MKFLGYLKDFESVLHHDILRRNKTTPALVFLSVLITFIIARLYALVYPYIRFSIIIKDYHFHHFFFGIIFISVACWMALVTDKFRVIRWASIIFGVGLGLVIDEWGLFITCGSAAKICDYWHRMSYDVFVIVIMLLLIVIYFDPFWRKIGKRIALRFLRMFGYKPKITTKK